MSAEQRFPDPPPGPEQGDDLRPPTGMTVAFRVRFDEAGADGLARASALLRYAQECAWVHSEALGFSREWYADRRLIWVVRCLELSVVGRATTGARLDVSTRVIGFRRVWARRRTGIRDSTGHLVATVESDWVMTDLRRGLPTRVPGEFRRLFEAPPGTFEPHRVALPAVPETAGRIPFAVRPHEVDPLAHANHAVYLDWLEEAVLSLPGGPGTLATVPRVYRLEYVSPVTSGQALVGRAWAIDDTCGIAYRIDGDGGERFRGTVVGGA